MSSSREEPYSAEKMLLYFHQVELTFNSPERDHGIRMESIHTVPPSMGLFCICASTFGFLVAVVDVQSQLAPLLC